MRSLRAVGAGLAVVLLTGASLAAERIHLVRSGESASSIAQRYYGDPELAPLLLRYNGKEKPALSTGERLRIPLCRVHLVASGDSWSGLAQKYLSRPSAHPVLASLNGHAPADPLRVGERIMIPVSVPHRLRGGETLADLAQRYYGDPGRSEVLRVFNGIEDPRRLAVGRTLQVPVVTLRRRDDAGRATRDPAKRSAPPPSRGAPTGSDPKLVHAGPERAPTRPATEQAAPSAQAQEQTAPRSPTPPQVGVGDAQFGEQVREATRAFSEGDYGRARRILEAIHAGDASAGTEAGRTEAHRLLAFVYVAFDLPGEACDAWQPVRHTPLDPARISPKIRQTLARCGEASTLGGT